MQLVNSSANTLVFASSGRGKAEVKGVQFCSSRLCKVSNGSTEDASWSLFRTHYRRYAWPMLPHKCFPEATLAFTLIYESYTMARELSSDGVACETGFLFEGLGVRRDFGLAPVSFSSYECTHWFPMNV